MAAPKSPVLAVITSIAFLGLTLVSCGDVATIAGSGNAQHATIIQDPDNPAARTYVAPRQPISAIVDAGSVVRDPENPFAGVFYAPTQFSGDRAVRDPDNPYWTGR